VKKHRFRIFVALLLIGALALASGELSLGPLDAHAARAIAAPRSSSTATKLASQSAAQLAKDYAKGRAYNVCTGLTAKARKSLGGGDSCVAKVKSMARVKRISKIGITKIAFRGNRVWANVSGYLNGDRKSRLAVAFKWEDGRYRLDHSLSSLSGLFGLGGRGPSSS
jgi:hypothetical protein